MTTFAERPELHAATVEEWESWLEAHAEDPDGVHLRLRRKAAAVPGIL